MFAASLLRIECGPLLTTQSTVGLGEKVVSPQASSTCCMCPVRRTEGCSCYREVGRALGFRLRGEMEVRRIEVGGHC